jgi:glycosyltransferase involved in cell wall biosynthesis
MAIKPKTVVFVVSALKKGGMERQLVTLLERINKKKFDVTLLLFSDELHYQLPNDVKVLVIRRRYKVDLLWFIRLVNTLGNYDVINSKISGVNEYVLLACLFIKRRNIICEIRNTGQGLKKFYKVSSALIKGFKLKPIFVANSELGLKELKMFLPNVRAFKVNNGVYTDKFQKQTAENEIETQTICSVGRVHKQKNFDCLIRAFSMVNKKLPQSRLLIVSGFIQDTEYYTYLKNIISELDLEERIDWRFQVDDMPDLYDIVDLFVLISDHEGTSNVLLEAMSCEKVCLVSNGANISDHFSSPFLLKNNKDIVEISDRLYECLQLDSFENRAVGEENRTFVKTNYGIEQMVMEYERLYGISLS